MNPHQNKTICSSLRRLAASAALVGAGLLSAPAQSTVILLGSDYFETVQPTFFTPLGALNPLAGLAFGPGTTDTIVQRQADCTLNLLSANSTCTIPIEMVALSLVSTVNPLVRLRETPLSVPGISRSGGTMMMTTGPVPSGTGGTFTSSFFDVFVDLSTDGGATFNPFGNVGPLISIPPTFWTTIEPLPPAFLTPPGSIPDQNANRHSGKNCPTVSCDFYLLGTVQEQEPLALHSARPARVPEPATLALMAAGLALLGWGKRRNRV